MSHLSDERLAALGDDTPTAAETQHLTDCADCGRELRAHRALMVMAGELRETRVDPLAPWSSISAELRSEGLLGARPVERVSWSVPMWARAAAAVVLVAGGMGLGRFSAGAPVLALGAAPAFATRSALDTVQPQFESTAQAAAVLARAQNEARGAVEFLAERQQTDGAPGPEVYNARMAALDEVLGALRDARDEAPAEDPVLNQAYISTLSAREVTARQMRQVQPTPVRLTRY